VAEFLRIDQDLLAAATEAATHEEEAGDPGRFKEWVKHLPAGERERWLLRAADHPSLALGSELLSAFHRVYPPVVAGQRRTVAELLARAEELEAERRRATADRAAQARAAAAAARDKRLATLAQRGAVAWQDLDQLVDARSYEEAVRLALDIHEVAVRAGELDEFGRRLADLKQRHARKRGFFDRLQRADPAPVGRCGTAMIQRAIAGLPGAGKTSFVEVCPDYGRGGGALVTRTGC